MSPSDLADRVISFGVRRMSRGIALALAAALCAAGYALPLLMHWPTLVLVLYSLAGSLLAAVVLLSCFVVRLEAGHRRRLVDWTSNLRLLTAPEFGWFVGEIFRREGYEVTETGKQDQPHGNIDLVLLRGGTKSVVQCKRWQAWEVGVDEVRKFAGTLMREGLRGESGIFVTLSNFTSQATKEAERLREALIDGRRLEDRWRKVRRTEPCPVCGQPMLVDKSPRGWWLRCISSGCNGKRDLGSEPGRALELLTQPPRTKG